MLTNRPDLDTVLALYHVLRQFGQIDESSITLTIKPPKNKPNKPPKFATAIALFKKIEGSFGAVESSGQEPRGLKDVEITWLSGEEPEAIRRLRDARILGDGGTPSNASVKTEELAGSASKPVSTAPAMSNLSVSTISFLYRLGTNLFVDLDHIRCEWILGWGQLRVNNSHADATSRAGTPGKTE